VLPGGRRHGHFPQIWQFLKAELPGKICGHQSGRERVLECKMAVIWQFKKLAL
jgi:hypothetical protein